MSIETTIDRERKRIAGILREKDEALAILFENCFSNSIATTVSEDDQGRPFVVTGDIPAMWLRDSMWQMAPYFDLAREDAELRDLLGRLVNRQAGFVSLEPYANAFNSAANGNHYHDDRTKQSPWVWECKYEVDSLCAPLYFGWGLWKATGNGSFFGDEYRRAIRRIAEVFRAEQRHETSEYSFERDNGVATDTLPCGGRGTPVAFTGMTWSGFRPSDDSCDYGYLVPANMMAVVALRRGSEIARVVYRDEALAAACEALAGEIDEGIRKHGRVTHPVYGAIYAYETDGLGHYNMMDDSNIPSLMSMPLLGYCSADDPVYQNTRRFALSGENPWYFEGQHIRGVGSPHTGTRTVWPMSVIVQAMTSNDDDEIANCLEMLANTTAGTNLMHESVNPDDPADFTRAWFGWANSLFSMLIMRLEGRGYFK